MYNPYENNDTNKNPLDPTEQGAQWNAPSGNQMETQWNGSSYHSGPFHSGGGQPPEKKPQKPQRWKTILIAALSCLVVSAGSVGVYAAITNSNSIQTTGTTQGTSSSVTSGSDSDAIQQHPSTQTGTSSSQELTKQEVAKKVIPSVVCIQTYSSTSNGFNLNKSQTKTGEGSGVIATADGYIITNAHVVDGASSVKVILSDNTTYEGKIIGSDTTTDLALIKIEATGLTPAEFGTSSSLQVADTVMAVGNPGGLEFQSSVTVGYVSALDREVTTSDSVSMKCIQTDAAINPGNSGGALVNMQGQVIGINSSKIVSTSYEGLGFSIPIDDALPVINDLKDYGYVKNRAVLSISGQYLDDITARWNQLPTGFYVGEINNESVSKEGLKVGDVITGIDGKEITSQKVLSSTLADKKPGEQVTLEVYRSSTGENKTLKITLSEYKPS